MEYVKLDKKSFCQNVDVTSSLVEMKTKPTKREKFNATGIFWRSEVLYVKVNI